MFGDSMSISYNPNLAKKVKFVQNYFCILVRDGYSDEAPKWDGSVHGRETKGISKFQLNFLQ